MRTVKRIQTFKCCAEMIENNKDRVLFLKCKYVCLSLFVFCTCIVDHFQASFKMLFRFASLELFEAVSFANGASCLLAHPRQKTFVLVIILPKMVQLYTPETNVIYSRKRYGYILLKKYRQRNNFVDRYSYLLMVVRTIDQCSTSQKRLCPKTHLFFNQFPEAVFTYFLIKHIQQQLKTKATISQTTVFYTSSGDHPVARFGHLCS